jgi:TPR repeat protein
LLALLPASGVRAASWAAGALDAGLSAYAAGDYAAARAQFVRLANHGSAIGETMLGTIYARGQGVPADAATAAAYWFRAANRGYAPAQLAMARALTSGAGVTANPAAAWVWARLAATHGDAATAAEAAALEARLTPLFTDAQRAQMTRQAEQWRPWADGGR